MAHRIVDYLGQRMEAKLEHDLSSVRLNRPDGDSQLRGDLFVRFPFCQEAPTSRWCAECTSAGTVFGTQGNDSSNRPRITKQIQSYYTQTYVHSFVHE